MPESTIASFHHQRAALLLLLATCNYLRAHRNPPFLQDKLCAPFELQPDGTPHAKAGQMARAIWKGTIAFGLVNIPVSLYSADARPDVQLHLIDSRNHARVRYERVNSETGEEVPWDVMVKGFEYEKGHYVLLSDDDMEKVKPTLTKTIAIDDFVALEDIDPILFDKPYFLEPDKRGQRAYALLRETLRETGKAGIAKVVIRTREYLTAMFVRGEAIVLMLLRFPQELHATSKLELPAPEEFVPQKREIQLAVQLVETMSVKWDPERYHDEYRAALIDYIETKVREGETAADVSRGTAKEEAEEPSGNVVNLMEYLQRSVEGSTRKAPPSSGSSDAKSKAPPKAPKKPKSIKTAKKAAARKASRKAANDKGRRSA